jgi:ribonuclease T2
MRLPLRLPLLSRALKQATVAVFAAMLLLPSITLAARAGSSDCILDHCADRQPAGASRAQTKPEAAAPPSAAPPSAETARTDGAEERGGVRHGPSKPGEFDFYVMSLSWSPGFCKLSEKSYSQCDAGANLGFVVHGLWPQYEHGFPEDCGGSSYPSRAAIDAAHGLYPDDGLARYEWRRHGTCSGKSPTDYFADVRRAREAITIPTAFLSAKDQQTLQPADIERAFEAANPKLKPGMIAVGCRSATLQDVKICFTKDLADFRACPELTNRDCKVHDLSVPPTR